MRCVPLNRKKTTGVDRTGHECQHHSQLSGLSTRRLKPVLAFGVRLFWGSSSKPLQVVRQRASLLTGVVSEVADSFDELQPAIDSANRARVKNWVAERLKDVCIGRSEV